MHVGLVESLAETGWRPGWGAGVGGSGAQRSREHRGVPAGERCLNKKFPVAMEFACEGPILCPNVRTVFFIRWSSLAYLILQNISENSPF